MAFVTIPTASYVGREKKFNSKLNKFLHENTLLPQLLPLESDFNQQSKLWRFYCTCLDVGSPNYKLEDFHKKNMTTKDKYAHWVKNWKIHYNDVTELNRLYKKSRSLLWFNAPEQEAYRTKLKNHLQTKYPNFWQHYGLYSYHISIVNDRLDSLRRSAQHLLNARYTAKLASQALVLRQRQKKEAAISQAA